ncbi:transposase family protein [Streptomyces mirabilis]|uniref:transposase family protein n=1 Tax=Streptomyces mirabilis TaxID=68239 RepID=UPI003650DBA3
MACPGCAVMSNRVHITYGKRLADTPVGDRPVLTELTVRRLYCENIRCSARECRKKAHWRSLSTVSSRAVRSSPTNRMANPV